jgi:hypothetical protein
MRIKSKIRKIYQNIATIAVTRRIPNNIVLLITVPRSGSTWLLDMLMQNENLNYISRYSIYRKLGLRGGRYPYDLCNKKLSNFKIEIQPYIWEKIQQNCKAKYTHCIEKIHPEYYQYDNIKLLNNVKKLSEEYNIKIILQTRDPIPVLNSWINYQKRNERWNSDITGKLLIDYMASSYKAITQLIQSNNYLTIDYNLLYSDTLNQLIKINKYLFNEDNIICNNHLQKNIDNCSRNKKIKGNFLGKEPGGLNNKIIDSVEYREKYGDDIERILLDYELHKSNN